VLTACAALACAVPTESGSNDEGASFDLPSSMLNDAGREFFLRFMA
jgi:hypothetical protein